MKCENFNGSIKTNMFVNEYCMKILDHYSSEYKHIYKRIYKWTVDNERRLMLNNDEEEIKHFGKRVRDFTDDEIQAYNDGFNDADRYLEAVAQILSRRCIRVLQRTD